MTGLEYDPGINVQGPEETTTAVSTDTGPGYITEDVTVAPTTTDTTVSVTQTSESRITTSVLSTDQADAASVNLTTDDSAAGDGGERLFTASVRSSGETSSSDDPITDFEGWCEENEIDINVLRDYLDGLFLTEAQFLTRLAIEGISADDFFNNSEIQFDTTGGFYIEQSNGTKLYFFSRTDDFNASDREQLNLLAGLLGGSIVKDTGRWYEATKYYFVDADGNEFRIDISYRDHFHYHGTVVYLEDVKEGDEDITFYIGGSNGAARGGWPITIEQDDDGVYSTIIVEGEDVTESFRGRDNALFGIHIDLNYAATDEALRVYLPAVEQEVNYLLGYAGIDVADFDDFLAKQDLTLLQFRALFQGKNTMGAFFKFLKEQVGLTDFETWMTDKDTNLSDFLTYFSDTDCSLTEFVNVLAAQNISIAAFFDVDKEDDVDKEAIIFNATGFQIEGEGGTTPIDFFDDEMIDLLNLRAREEVDSFSRFLEGEIRVEEHWWYGNRLVWYGPDGRRDVLKDGTGTWTDAVTGRKLRFTISTDRTVLTIGLEESDKTLRVTRNEYTNEIESVIDTASGQDVMARYTDTYTYGGVTYSSYGRGFAQAVNEGALARYEELYGSLQLDDYFRGRLADTDPEGINVNGLTEEQFLAFLETFDLTLNDFYARLAEQNLSIESFFRHAKFDAKNNNFFLVDILDADNNKIYLFDENSKDNLTPEARALLDNLVIFAEGEVEERFNKFLGFLWDTTSKGFYWNGIKMQSVDGGGYLWTDEDGHEMNLQVSTGSNGRACYEVSGGGLELRIEMGDGKEGSVTTIWNLQTREDITISDLANYGKTTGFNHAALVELDTLVDTPIVEEEIGVTLAEYGFSRMEFAQFLLDIMGNDGYGDEEGFLYTYFQELKDAGTYETRAQAFLLFLKEKEGLSFDRFLSLLQEKDISLANFALLTRIDATNGRLYVVGLDGKEIDDTSRMYSFEDYLDSYVDLLPEEDRATIDSITKFCDGRVYKKWVWDGGMTWFWEGADGRTVRMDDMDYGSTTWEDLDTGVVLEIYDHNKIRLGNGNVIQFSFEGEGGLFSGGTLSGAEDITTTDDITDITDDLYAKEAVYAKGIHSDTWAVINSNVRALQELTAVVHSEDPLTFDYMMEFLTQSGLEFDEVLSGLKYENGRPYILDDAGNKLFLFNEEQVNIFGVSEVELERLLSFLNGQIFEHAGLLYWTDNAGTLRVIDGQLQRGEGGGYFHDGVSVNPLTIDEYGGTSIDDDGNVVLLQDNMAFLVDRDGMGNLSVSYAGRMINADNFEEITSYMGQAVFRVVNSEALAYFWDKSVDILNKFILQYTVIYMHLDTVVNELRAIRERDAKDTDKEKLAEERTERAKTEKRLLEAMQELKKVAMEYVQTELDLVSQAVADWNKYQTQEISQQIEYLYRSRVEIIADEFTGEYTVERASLQAVLAGTRAYYQITNAQQMLNLHLLMSELTTQSVIPDENWRGDSQIETDLNEQLNQIAIQINALELIKNDIRNALEVHREDIADYAFKSNAFDLVLWLPNLIWDFKDDWIPAPTETFMNVLEEAIGSVEDGGLLSVCEEDGSTFIDLNVEFLRSMELNMTMYQVKTSTMLNLWNSYGNMVIGTAARMREIDTSSRMYLQGLSQAVEDTVEADLRKQSVSFGMLKLHVMEMARALNDHIRDLRNYEKAVKVKNVKILKTVVIAIAIVVCIIMAFLSLGFSIGPSIGAICWIAAAATGGTEIAGDLVLLNIEKETNDLYDPDTMFGANMTEVFEYIEEYDENCEGIWKRYTDGEITAQERDAALAREKERLDFFIMNSVTDADKDECKNVWQQYLDGEISAGRRDSLLAGLDLESRNSFYQEITERLDEIEVEQAAILHGRSLSELSQEERERWTVLELDKAWNTSLVQFANPGELLKETDDKQWTIDGAAMALLDRNVAQQFNKIRMLFVAMTTSLDMAQDSIARNFGVEGGRLSGTFRSQLERFIAFQSSVVGYLKFENQELLSGQKMRIDKEKRLYEMTYKLIINAAVTVATTIVFVGLGAAIGTMLKIGVAVGKLAMIGFSLGNVVSDWIYEMTVAAWSDYAGAKASYTSKTQGMWVEMEEPEEDPPAKTGDIGTDTVNMMEWLDKKELWATKELYDDGIQDAEGYDLWFGVEVHMQQLDYNQFAALRQKLADYASIKLMIMMSLMSAYETAGKALQSFSGIGGGYGIMSVLMEVIETENDAKLKMVEGMQMEMQSRVEALNKQVQAKQAITMAYTQAAIGLLTVGFSAAGMGNFPTASFLGLFLRPVFQGVVRAAYQGLWGWKTAYTVDDIEYRGLEFLDWEKAEEEGADNYVEEPGEFFRTTGEQQKVDTYGFDETYIRNTKFGNQTINLMLLYRSQVMMERRKRLFDTFFNLMIFYSKVILEESENVGNVEAAYEFAQVAGVLSILYAHQSGQLTDVYYSIKNRVDAHNRIMEQRRGFVKTMVKLGVDLVQALIAARARQNQRNLGAKELQRRDALKRRMKQGVGSRKKYKKLMSRLGEKIGLKTKRGLRSFPTLSLLTALLLFTDELIETGLNAVCFSAFWGAEHTDSVQTVDEAAEELDYEASVTTVGREEIADSANLENTLIRAQAKGAGADLLTQQLAMDYLLAAILAGVLKAMYKGMISKNEQQNKAVKIGKYLGAPMVAVSKIAALKQNLTAQTFRGVLDEAKAGKVLDIVAGGTGLKLWGNRIALASGFGKIDDEAMERVDAMAAGDSLDLTAGERDLVKNRLAEIVAGQSMDVKTLLPVWMQGAVMSSVTTGLLAMGSGLNVFGGFVVRASGLFGTLKPEARQKRETKRQKKLQKREAEEGQRSSQILFGDIASARGKLATASGADKLVDISSLTRMPLRDLYKSLLVASITGPLLDRVRDLLRQKEITIEDVMNLQAAVEAQEAAVATQEVGVTSLSAEHRQMVINLQTTMLPARYMVLLNQEQRIKDSKNVAQDVKTYNQSALREVKQALQKLSKEERKGFSDFLVKAFDKPLEYRKVLSDFGFDVVRTAAARLDSVWGGTLLARCLSDAAIGGLQSDLVDLAKLGKKSKMLKKTDSVTNQERGRGDIKTSVGYREHELTEAILRPYTLTVGEDLNAKGQLREERATELAAQTGLHILRELRVFKPLDVYSGTKVFQELLKTDRKRGEAVIRRMLQIAGTGEEADVAEKGEVLSVMGNLDFRWKEGIQKQRVSPEFVTDVLSDHPDFADTTMIRDIARQDPTMMSVIISRLPASAEYSKEALINLSVVLGAIKTKLDTGLSNVLGALNVDTPKEAASTRLAEMARNVNRESAEKALRYLDEAITSGTLTTVETCALLVERGDEITRIVAAGFACAKGSQAQRLAERVVSSFQDKTVRNLHLRSEFYDGLSLNVERLRRDEVVAPVLDRNWADFAQRKGVDEDIQESLREAQSRLSKKNIFRGIESPEIIVANLRLIAEQEGETRRSDYFEGLVLAEPERAAAVLSVMDERVALNLLNRVGRQLSWGLAERRPRDFKMIVSFLRAVPDEGLINLGERAEALLTGVVEIEEAMSDDGAVSDVGVEEAGEVTPPTCFTADLAENAQYFRRATNSELRRFLTSQGEAFLEQFLPVEMTQANLANGISILSRLAAVVRNPEFVSTTRSKVATILSQKLKEASDFVWSDPEMVEDVALRDDLDFVGLELSRYYEEELATSGDVGREANLLGWFEMVGLRLQNGDTDIRISAEIRQGLERFLGDNLTDSQRAVIRHTDDVGELVWQLDKITRELADPPAQIMRMLGDPVVGQIKGFRKAARDLERVLHDRGDLRGAGLEAIATYHPGVLRALKQTDNIAYLRVLRAIDDAGRTIPAEAADLAGDCGDVGETRDLCDKAIEVGNIEELIKMRQTQLKETQGKLKETQDKLSALDQTAAQRAGLTQTLENAREELDMLPIELEGRQQELEAQHAELTQTIEDASEELGMLPIELEGRRHELEAQRAELTQTLENASAELGMLPTALEGRQAELGGMFLRAEVDQQLAFLRIIKFGFVARSLKQVDVAHVADIVTDLLGRIDRVEARQVYEANGVLTGLSSLARDLYARIDDDLAQLPVLAEEAYDAARQGRRYQSILSTMFDILSRNDSRLRGFDDPKILQDSLVETQEQKLVRLVAVLNQIEAPTANHHLESARTSIASLLMQQLAANPEFTDGFIVDNKPALTEGLRLLKEFLPPGDPLPLGEILEHTGDLARLVKVFSRIDDQPGSELLVGLMVGFHSQGGEEAQKLIALLASLAIKMRANLPNVTRFMQTLSGMGLEVFREIKNRDQDFARAIFDGMQFDRANYQLEGDYQGVLDAEPHAQIQLLEQTPIGVSTANSLVEDEVIDYIDGLIDSEQRRVVLEHRDLMRGSSQRVAMLQKILVAQSPADLQNIWTELSAEESLSERAVLVGHALLQRPDTAEAAVVEIVDRLGYVPFDIAQANTGKLRHSVITTQGVENLPFSSQGTISPYISTRGEQLAASHIAQLPNKKFDIPVFLREARNTPGLRVAFWQQLSEAADSSAAMNLINDVSGMRRLQDTIGNVDEEVAMLGFVQVVYDRFMDMQDMGDEKKLLNIYGFLRRMQAGADQRKVTEHFQVLWGQEGRANTDFASVLANQYLEEEDKASLLVSMMQQKSRFTKAKAGSVLKYLEGRALGRGVSESEAQEAQRVMWQVMQELFENHVELFSREEGRGYRQFLAGFIGGLWRDEKLDEDSFLAFINGISDNLGKDKVRMAVLTDVMSRIETGGLTLHTFDSRKAIDKHKARIQRKTQLFGQKKYLKRWAQMTRSAAELGEDHSPTNQNFVDLAITVVAKRTSKVIKWPGKEEVELAKTVHSNPVAQVKKAFAGDRDAKVFFEELFSTDRLDDIEEELEDLTVRLKAAGAATEEDVDRLAELRREVADLERQVARRYVASDRSLAAIRTGRHTERASIAALSTRVSLRKDLKRLSEQVETRKASVMQTRARLLQDLFRNTDEVLVSSGLAQDLLVHPTSEVLGFKPRLTRDQKEALIKKLTTPTREEKESLSWSWRKKLAKTGPKSRFKAVLSQIRDKVAALPAATSDDDKNFYRENLALLYVQDPLGFKQHFSEEEYAAFNTALSIDFEKVDKLRVQRQVRSSDLSRNSFYEMALAAKALGSRTVQKLIPNFDRDFEKLTADQRRKVQELEEFVIRQSMPSLAADRNIGVDVLKERKKVLDLVQKGAELLGQEKMPKECEVMKMQKECEAMKKYVSLLVRRVDEGEDARVVLRGLMPDERYQRYTYLLFNLRATQVPDDSDTESVGSLTDSVTSVGSDLIIEDDTDSLSDGEESEEEDLAANWGEALV